MNKLFLLPLLVFTISKTSFRLQTSDDIIGRWMSSEKNLEVSVFKVDNEYKARVIWFDDSDDKLNPMNTRTDKMNSNKTLRSRKIIGLEVMHGLIYNADNNEWQHGWIYDSSSGKTWNAKACMTKGGQLKVRGYWHFEFLGKNMIFNKVP